MLSAVIQGCQDYYDQIPSDTLPKVARSALYTFTATLILGKDTAHEGVFNLTKPLIAAGVAALASLIYGLTVPFFNQVFGDDRILFGREFIKQFVNVIVTSIIVDYLVTGKVNLVSLKTFGSVSVNMFLGVFESSATLADWLGAPSFANEMRDWYKAWGLDAVPGSSSLFIYMGYIQGMGVNAG